MCMCVCACVDWTGESSINDDRDKIEMANALESLTRKNHSFSIYYGKKTPNYAQYPPACMIPLCKCDRDFISCLNC
jgi:hypothetical protein